MFLKPCVATAILLLLPVLAHADGIPACSGGSVVPDSLIGTSCTVGPLEFTFFQSSDSGPNPDGIFSTEAVALTPTIIHLPGGANGSFTTVVGFDLGPLALGDEQQGDLGYSVSMLPGSSGSMVGVFQSVTGETTSPTGPFPNVGGFFELCPGTSTSLGCIFDVNQVQGGPSSESLFDPLEYPHSYVSSGNGSHLGVECNEASCQLDSASYFIVVTPEPSALSLTLAALILMMFVGLSPRVFLFLNSKRSIDAPRREHV